MDNTVMNRPNGRGISAPDDELLVSPDGIDGWAREFADAFQQNPSAVLRSAKTFAGLWREKGLTNGALRQLLRFWMSGAFEDTPRIKNVLGTCLRMRYLPENKRERVFCPCEICDEYGYVLIRGYLRGFQEPYFTFRLCSCDNADFAYPKTRTWEDEGVFRGRVFSPIEEFAWWTTRDDQRARALAASWRKARWEETRERAQPVEAVVDSTIPF